MTVKIEPNTADIYLSKCGSVYQSTGHMIGENDTLMELKCIWTPSRSCCVRNNQSWFIIETGEWQSEEENPNFHKHLVRRIAP